MFRSIWQDWRSKSRLEKIFINFQVSSQNKIFSTNILIKNFSPCTSLRHSSIYFLCLHPSQQSGQRLPPCADSLWYVSVFVWTTTTTTVIAILVKKKNSQSVSFIRTCKLPQSDRSPLPKIIGGEDVDPDRYPYFALMNGRGGLCGGVLISKRFVLTAARECSIKWHKNPNASIWS